MTARAAIVLFLLGTTLWVIGAALKVQHWPYGDVIISGGSVMQTVAMLVLSYKVFRYPGFKDFLDR